jgi:hypothetical protein
MFHLFVMVCAISDRGDGPPVAIASHMSMPSIPFRSACATNQGQTIYKEMQPGALFFTSSYDYKDDGGNSNGGGGGAADDEN